MVHWRRFGERALPSYKEKLSTVGFANGVRGCGAGDRTRTCTPLREEDSKSEWKGRRINLLLIRCPFPFTRSTRSALQSEEYGHPDGHPEAWP